MIAEPITISGKIISPPNQAMPPERKEIAKKETGDEREEKESADLEHVAESVVKAQKNLSGIHNTDLQFSVNKDSGDVMVTVTDEKTGEVIREIPSSEVRNLASRLEEMVGVIFNQTG